jgi:hypothetical protein
MDQRITSLSGMWHIGSIVEQEDEVKVPCSDGRMDPVLRLYHSCRLMLPVYKNVNEGQANGLQVTLKKVVLKPNVQS